MRKLLERLLSPAFMRQLNGWATLFFIVLIPVSIATGWINSVVFIAALSMWALVSAHLVGYLNARTEERQDQQLEQQDDELDQHESEPHA